jgi:hypothetical protein
VVDNECVRALHSLQILLKTFTLMMKQDMETGAIAPYKPDDSKDNRTRYKGQLEGVFLQALLWSTSGVMTSVPNRQRYTLFLRALFHSSNALKNKYPAIQRRLKLDKWKPPSFFVKGKRIRQFVFPLPESDNFYDQCFTTDSETGVSQWLPWKSLPLDYHEATMKNNSKSGVILVPTTSTTMTIHHLKRLMEEKTLHFLLGGPVGCGKSLGKSMPLVARLCCGVGLIHCCFYGVRVVLRVVYVWCYVWCTCGVRVMYVWCTCGAFLVHLC